MLGEGFKYVTGSEIVRSFLNYERSQCFFQARRGEFASLYRLSQPLLSVGSQFLCSSLAPRVEIVG